MTPTGIESEPHISLNKGCLQWANGAVIYDCFNLFFFSLTELPSTAVEKPDIEDIGVIDLGEEPEYKSPEQISNELITLSGQPTSRWLNLLNLDVIKRRNKPKTPLTIPKSAPFFLPTIPSLELEFDLEKDKSENGNKKFLIPDSLTTLTVFCRKLNECEEDFEFEKCIEKFKSMSPSNIEAEITGMDPETGGTIDVMKKFLNMLEVMLNSNRDFELAQSYLGLFLKIHAKIISKNDELVKLLDVVEESATKAWSKIQNSLMYNICVVKALKDM